MKRKLFTGLALGLLTLGILGAFGDFSKVYDIVKGVSLKVIFGALLLSLANYTIRFFKWHYYLRLLGHDVSYKNSFKIYYSGLSMAITPGKFGEVIKSSLMASMEGVQEHETLPVVITERLVDLVSVLFLIGAGLGGVIKTPGVFIGGVVLTLFFFLLFTTDIFGRRIYKVLGRMLLKRLGEEQVDRAMQNQRLLLRPVPFLIGTLLSALAWASEAIGMYIIVLGLGGKISWLDAIFVYSTGTLAGAISMIPGGLVATEASLTGLLSPEVLHVFSDKAHAVAATILVRLCTLWFAVLVGGITLLMVRKDLRTSSEQKVTP